MKKDMEYLPVSVELENCRRRNQELESRISDLRMSRRVLMDLLEHAQSSRQAELESLCRENKRLHKQLSSCARQLWARKGRLTQAEGGMKHEV
ncbi:MAG: translation initiation factor 2 [Bacillota bacterium]|nr:translation initiation factor 2 [Bacillota bacterium]